MAVEPGRGGGWIGRDPLLLLALCVAGLAGNYLKVTLFLNIDFLFGSIFALLALQFFGFAPALIASAVISGYTFVLWNHPYAIVIMTAEVAVVGLLRRRKIGMVPGDALYWLFIGMPLVYLFYHVAMHVPWNMVKMIMIKQSVNGIANAIVARMLITGYSFRSREVTVPFREVLSNLLALFVLGPGLILLVIGCRSDFTEVDHTIRAGLMADIADKSRLMETWVGNRQRVINRLAEIAGTTAHREMQSRLEWARGSDPNFLRMGLLDGEAVTVAFDPLRDELGAPNLGRSFADRPFIPVMKRTLKPMLSDIYMGRVGSPAPVVSVVAPVVVGKEYHGYVIGVLSLQYIKELLDHASGRSGLLYTLLDRNGKVVMTNRKELGVMAPFVRGPGKLTRLDGTISEWIPNLPPNTPAAERWRKSYYVSQATIGQLAEWRLVLEQPVAPFQMRLNDSYTQKFTLLFAILLISLALAELLSRALVRTLEKLSLVTHDLPARIGSGEAVEWPVSGLEETSNLVGNFQQMGGRIDQLVKALKQLNDSLELRVEQRTRQLEQLANQQRIILANMPVGVCLVKNGKVEMANPAFDRILGYEPGETVGLATASFHVDAAAGSGEVWWGALISRGEVFSADLELAAKGGIPRWCHLIGQAISVDRPEEGALWIIHDIAERKSMESQLRDREAHYRLLTEDVSDVVWKLDAGYRITYLSPADEKLRGYPSHEMVGRTIFELTTEEGSQTIMDKLHQEADPTQPDAGGPTVMEIQQRCKDGRLIWTEVTATVERDHAGRVAGYHGITRDITERKQKAELEQQLLHAQKLESLGVLAGGIAHDFNNILMAIIGNADLASMQLSAQSPVLENLHRIQEASKRAADLTKQMLAYSGKGRFMVEIVDLNLLLDNMLHLLQASVSKKAQLVLELEKPLPPLEADAAQLRQIVMNLVLNASEALGDESGIIAISTRVADCDREALRRDWHDEKLAEGRYVVLEVRDTGCGMEKETLERLFDPFFTTKFTGRGLGMAAVLGIVKGHKGSVRVTSEPSRGATVSILLPASRRVAELLDAYRETHDQTEQPAARESLLPRGGKVLLVDDEEAVRRVGVEMLGQLGYSAIEAVDGEHAVEIFKANPVELVILDLTMPRMDGEQCLKELQRLKPGVRVIMSSGYSEQEIAPRLSGKGVAGFIQKPYTVGALREAISRGAF
ncbi:PAS domain S-box protein [Geomonas sp. Red32]|uniref:PAS domain S-box protein n=1 Tax=Geomonas sp. Red32 TaxID=2912856 RepID=UPI00202CEE07|nr:PAS domain S-box protein [Geomonas sp. Red32]MCM0082572.1 PAS domain S-box protein [Geomonas sp. Red32]